MNLLVDTHVVIWSVDKPTRLSPTATVALADPSNVRLISVASIWEIAIKLNNGKLNLSSPFRPWNTKAFSDLNASLLPITIDHAELLANLPHHHRDPFDCLLIAQALLDQISIVSSDKQFDSYGVNRIW